MKFGPVAGHKEESLEFCMLPNLSLGSLWRAISVIGCMASSTSLVQCQSLISQDVSSGNPWCADGSIEKHNSVRANALGVPRVNFLCINCRIRKVWGRGAGSGGTGHVSVSG